MLLCLSGLNRRRRGTVDLDGCVDNTRSNVRALDGFFEIVDRVCMGLREEGVAEVFWDGFALLQRLESCDLVLEGA